jgi:hypothetical protein
MRRLESRGGGRLSDVLVVPTAIEKYGNNNHLLDVSCSRFLFYRAEQEYENCKPFGLSLGIAGKILIQPTGLGFENRRGQSG